MADFVAAPKVAFDPANPKPQNGKASVLFFRALKNAATESGKKLAFQTEHSKTITNEVSATQTKDGAINSSAGATFEYPISCILTKNDPLRDMLESAVINSDIMECWEVVIDDDMTNASDQYLATYMQGLLTSWEETLNSEESVTASTTLMVNHIPQKGYLDLTAAEQAAVQYAFRVLAPYTGDETAPGIPTVDAVTTASVAITGIAEAKSIVLAKVGSAILGSTVADTTDGDFAIAIDPQTLGTVITVVSKDAAGNVSAPATVTVTA